MDKPKPETRLQQHRRQHADATLDRALKRLAEKPKRTDLITVLNASTRPAAHELATRIEQCRPGRKTRCYLAICPSCGPLIQSREKTYVWQKLIGHNKGEMPEMQHLSYVTIDGPKLNSLDPAVITKTRSDFNSSLKACQSNKLKDTAWIGLMDMGLGDESAIHVHLVIHHPNRTRRSLRKELKAVFSGDRAVCVNEWYKDSSRFYDHTKALVDRGFITMEEANLDNATAYITKLGIKPPKEAMIDVISQTRAYQIAATVDELADRWIKLCVIRGKKFKNARIKYGIKSVKGAKWYKNALAIPNGIDGCGSPITEIRPFKFFSVLGGLYNRMIRSQEQNDNRKKQQDKRLIKLFAKQNPQSSDSITVDNGLLEPNNRVDVGGNRLPTTAAQSIALSPTALEAERPGSNPVPRPLRLE